MGLPGCGFSLQNYLILLCRRNELGFENLAEKFCFSLEIGFFLSERYNFVLFRPTWGNIYLFLVVFLDMNRSVCIWKQVHKKSEPTGISSSWSATCLNEFSVSLQLLFVFVYFPLPLDFSVPYFSSNRAGSQLYNIMNWLEVIGLVFLASLRQKIYFSRQNFSFRRSLSVSNCFKSDSNISFSGLSGSGFSLQNYLILLCRRNGSGFENLAEKFYFSLEIGLFLSERYNFVLF